MADQLVDMGFERAHAERAAACNANLEQVGWKVLEHNNSAKKV